MDRSRVYFALILAAIVATTWLAGTYHPRRVPREEAARKELARLQNSRWNEWKPFDF